jgi:diacylglycerol kinase family enzyme
MTRSDAMLSKLIFGRSANGAGTRPEIRRVTAVVNGASGSVGPEAVEAMRTLLLERNLDVTILAPDPKEIEEIVRLAVETAPDLLIILAGDGTARLAGQLCGPKGPLLAPLPGGTLNLLPHAIYGTVPWREALASALDDGLVRNVCGGRLDGHAFYCSAVLGSPALWARAREAVRHGRLIEAWRRAAFALRRAFTGDIHYALDGGPARAAEALLLISPMISKVIQEETVLEVAALEMHSASEVFRLAFNGLVSDWRQDPGVVDEVCRKGQVWARRAIPAILDGEVVRLQNNAKFNFEPTAFRVLAPSPTQAEAQTEVAA